MCVCVCECVSVGDDLGTSGNQKTKTRKRCGIPLIFHKMPSVPTFPRKSSISGETYEVSKWKELQPLALSVITNSSKLFLVRHTPKTAQNQMLLLYYSFKIRPRSGEDLHCLGQSHSQSVTRGDGSRQHQMSLKHFGTEPRLSHEQTFNTFL